MSNALHPEYEQESESIKERYSELKKHFDGILSDEDEMDGKATDHLRAITILMHAEIESFLERKARHLVDIAESTWRENCYANYHAVHLIAWSFRKKPDAKMANDPVKASCALFRKQIDGNNGIKEEDIEKLFKPLGFTIEEFDNELLVNLSTFGTHRGAMVHASQVGIQREFSWREMDELIANILNQLPDFESALDLKRHLGN